MRVARPKPPDVIVVPAGPVQNPCRDQRRDDDRSIVSILRVDHRADVYAVNERWRPRSPASRHTIQPEAVLRHTDETSLTGCRATCGSSPGSPVPAAVSSSGALWSVREFLR
jgi:hypothetical protein